MKKFTVPEIEMKIFEVRDILTTSGEVESTNKPYVPVDPELPGDDFE